MSVWARLEDWACGSVLSLTYRFAPWFVLRRGGRRAVVLAPVGGVGGSNTAARSVKVLGQHVEDGVVAVVVVVHGSFVQCDSVLSALTSCRAVRQVRQLGRDERCAS